MDVDGPAARDVEHGLGQDLTEGHDHRDVGVELGEPLGPAGLAQARRLDHRHSRPLRALLDGGRRHPLAATGGLVGLGDGGNNGVTLEQGLEGGQRELRRAVEENAHGA